MNKTRVGTNILRFFKKIALIFLGLVLFIVLSELGLRFGGFIRRSVQEQENLRSVKQKGVYRILCLGESTTERQYPHFLEKILNQRNIGVKFSVIDKGRTTATTPYLLSRIESYLNENHPNMVVAMMGINDKGIKYYEEIPDSDTWLFKHCRFYRFCRIMYMHLSKKTDFRELAPKDSGRKAEPSKANTILDKTEPKAWPQSPYKIKSRIYWGQKFTQAENAFKKEVALNPQNENAYIRLARVCEDHGYPEAQELLKKALAINPQNANAYAELGRISLDQAQITLAEDLFKKAIAIDPRNDMAYAGLGKIRRKQGDLSQAQTYFKKAVQLNPRSDYAYAELGQLYLDQGSFALVEDSWRKAVEFNPENHNAFIDLGRIYRILGKFPEAEEAFKKSIEINPVNDYVYSELGELYRLEGKLPLAEDVFMKALEFNPQNDRAAGALSSIYTEIGKPELIKEYAAKIAMLRLEDYPAVTVNNYRKLKRILDQKNIKLVCVQYPVRKLEPLKKIFEGDPGVIFVDNEEIFKRALRHGSYHEYFTDMFAGDFGHCTPKGNMLIAQNIADVILKEVFHRS